MITLVLCALAVWRIAYMLQEENGPAGIFARFRAFAAKHSTAEIGGFYEGYTCFYCLSAWLAIIPAVLLSDTLYEPVLYTLSISTLSIFVSLIHNKLEQ